MTLGNNDIPPSREDKGFARDLVDAARENPASTALIGMGLLWMVMGRNGGSVFGKVRGMGRSAATGIGAGGRMVGAGASSVTTSVSNAVSGGLGTIIDHASDIGAAASQRFANHASGVVSAGSGTVASVGDGIRAAAHDARDMAANAAASVKGVGERFPDGALDRAPDLLASMRGGFADLLRRQPFVLGAAGLVVGAGVAAVLPRIAAEDVFAGRIGDLKESVREGFGNAYDRAAEEARVQGLTPEAASQAVSDIGDKVKTVAKTTLDDTKKSFS